jgi:hypothetical protein
LANQPSWTVRAVLRPAPAFATFDPPAGAAPDQGLSGGSVGTMPGSGLITMARPLA